MEKADPNNDPQSAPAQEQTPPPLTFLQMVGSTLAAALGVQSRKNRERDFNRGKPIHFILLGLAFTVLFVFVVVAIVNLVLS